MIVIIRAACFATIFLIKFFFFIFYFYFFILLKILFKAKLFSVN